MLTLLTPTGGRPEAFALCMKWMLNQTYTESIKWIIINDGHEEIDCSTLNTKFEIHYKKFDPTSNNTQALNLLRGLDFVEPTDRLLIIEDDDYYKPQWLHIVDDWFKTYDLVGEGDTIYYNIKHKKYRQNKHTKHASLCATGMKNEALKVFREVCASNKQGIDHTLWRLFRGSKLIEFSNNVIGIKGMPGRAGLGKTFHTSARQFGANDLNGEYLHKLMENDAEFYL